ncbi:MAG: rhodanese-like domain-containing protein [Gammaproteobacteria bacterium]|nr:rhodanese-like domain-containing protein [Gammaproteobacteria bacterium]MDP2430609.1 rhodanese-like domain-containing protein [Pseudomonadota bacterium]
MFGMYNIKELGVDDLDANKEQIHLIDVRTEGEVSRGVINGAIHIPLHLLPLRATEIPQNKPVVIYCNSGARSAQACAFMAAKGFENMHNLSGGIMAWARSGKPLAALS